MDIKLKVLEGKNAGREIAVAGQKFFIGRAEDCQLRPGSDMISRHHCVLLVEDGSLSVRDFGSKNGTFVNEERVIGERELKAGDRLTVGPLRFEVVVTHGLAARKRPPVGDVKEAAARAAHDAAQDPLDVTQWLMGDPAPGTGTVSREAETVNLGDTESIQGSNTQTALPAPEPQKAEPKVSPGKRPVGKLPVTQNTTKDSQAAAEAMLNKMRRRH